MYFKSQFKCIISVCKPITANHLAMFNSTLNSWVVQTPAANGKLVIGSSYELTAFGLGICSAEFVLTTNNETGANCDEFQHTQSLQVKALDFSDCTESNDIGKIILNTKAHGLNWP